MSLETWRAGLRGARLLLLTGALVACTSREPEGSNCQFNGDCVEPLVCAGRFCRGQCATDRDCPPMYHCSASDAPRQRVCLPPPAAVLCVANEDCPARALCAQGNVCRWRCASDGECPTRPAGNRCQSSLCTEPVLVSELVPAPLDAGGGDVPDAAEDGGTDAGDLGAPDDAVDAGVADDTPDVPDVPEAIDVPDVPDVPEVIDVPDVPDVPEVMDVGLSACDGTEPPGTRCPLPGAFGVCQGTTCVVERCSSNFGDCDRDPANGCETDLRTAASHCGACGAACRGGPNTEAVACTSGACRIMACRAGFDDCDGDLDNGCEIELSTDSRHCGRCNNLCTARPNAVDLCAAGSCGIARCAPGFGDCDGDPTNGCEVDLRFDSAQCGRCGVPCPSGAACVASSCVEVPFPSDGSEESYDPQPRVADGGVPQPTVVMLAPGLHQYRTIRIRPQITVRTSGVGELDLRATGAVLIEGTVDVSGADGAIAGSGSDDDRGVAGGGGATGDPGAPGARGMVGACGAPGAGGRGARGTSIAGIGTHCGAGGFFGGGTGGETGRPAGGGGGYAGGGGGAGGSAAGGAGASFLSTSRGGSGGMPTAGARGGRGGETGLAVYGGGNGGETAESSGEWKCGAGGGGSIGADAARDLPVETSFRPGSGGGGGAGNTSRCQGPCRAYQGDGGGGGGGAIRIASARSIEITGSVLANGGRGAGARENFGGCAGGGGSGGVIYLAAPTIDVGASARISAAGGPGGTAAYGGTNRGGAGGMGRIRLAVVPGRCTRAGSFVGVWNPPLLGGVCAPTPAPGTAGSTFVGAFPN